MKKTIASSTPWKKTIYNQKEFYESWEKSDRFFHAHLVSQTLRGAYSYLLKPDQVFYVGSYPTAYILEIDNVPTEAEEEKWRKFLWNQSVVPILIVKVAKKEIRVYTANEYKHDIAETLTYTADALDLLETTIESGSFFGEMSMRFSRSQAVDHYLLTNLNNAVKMLYRSCFSEQDSCFIEKIKSQGKNAEKEDRQKVDCLIQEQQVFVQLYLTRILFICYLIDRGMLKGKNFPSTSRLSKITPTDSSSPHRLADVLNECTTPKEKRDVLKRVFAETKKRFNGSLFEYGKDSKQSDAPEVSDTFLSDLTVFLNGGKVGSGQKVFEGLFVYDFNIIPIEMISSIYESFLGALGIQRTSGAYYTPPHLAELVVDIALEDVKDKKIYEMDVLDPSCGSGVFLVSLFCRMADQLRRHLKYKSVKSSSNWGKRVIELLTRIHGIDSNSTACHIACFSLYLAALEQLKPTDLDDLGDGILPPLLSDPEKGHKRGENIIKANFFDPKLLIERQKFDLIVGNPPWVNSENQNDSVFLKWKEKNEVSKPTPNTEIAYGFLWETKSLLAENGVACLLVPASVLWSDRTNLFLAKWLRSTTVERIVNFSDLSFLLFSGSDHPCVAIRFMEGYSSGADHVICYESPKTDVRTQQGGPLIIREEDRTYLFQENTISGADMSRSSMIWKVPFWGKGRDQRLVERLSIMPNLGDLAGGAKSKTVTRWFSGDGIQEGACKKLKKGEWTLDTHFLSPDVFSRQGLIVDEGSLKTVGEENIPLEVKRPRTWRLFSGPRVLVSQGSQINVSYCEKDVLFKDSISAISGAEEDAPYLKFLSVVIKSDLMRYYLFHSAPFWGSERKQIALVTYRSIPFFLPENAPDPKLATQCVSEVTERFKLFESRVQAAQKSFSKGLLTDFDPLQTSEVIRKECEPFVRKYYGINHFESNLIDDTLGIIIPSITPSAGKFLPTLQRVVENQCQIYANELVDMLKAFSWKEKGHPYSAHVYMPGVDDQYGIIRVDRSQEKGKDVTVSNNSKELQEAIRRISKHLDQYESERIIHCLSLKVFDGESLFILKPAQLRFWTRIAAQNDADEIGGSLMQRIGRTQ